MLIFLDLETTGLDHTDKICSIALIAIWNAKIEVFDELVNEGKKIPPLASSINHITNEMIKGKPTLTQSSAYKFLQEHNLATTTIISHNASFDLEKLSACGFIFHGKIIDTLRVSKHLFEDTESFALQYLRYDLKLYKQEEKEAEVCGIGQKIVAHDALSDTLVVKLLYNYLLEVVPHQKMVELSTQNVLMQKFDFGKYSGRYIEEISMIDKGYLHWMLNSIVDLDEDLRYSIEYYLGENI